MPINVLGKFRKAFVGEEGLMDAADVQLDATNLVGLLSGTTDIQDALTKFDATGVGASIFNFTGSYSAQASNINEWFGGKQLVRMRCTDSNIGVGSSGTVTFNLPGASALGTAFDQLVATGLPEIIRFVIEYTGPAKDQLNILPRAAPSPQITGTTSILVRSGIAAQLEVTRTSGTISNYVFQSIGAVDAGSDFSNSLRLQNPAQVVWDASATGVLPTTVDKGFAFKVANAPTDGSGRFGEVMYNGDWVVWEGTTFTSWAAEPHQWFVLAAHDVRRISALETDFLSDVAITPISNRNAIIRGADYADTAGEIRLKIYPTVADYSAADLNTTGDVDEYTDTSDQTGILAIRLPGTQATLADVLPTLYIYSEDGSGNFTLLGNMSRDFHPQGDFGSESDYTSEFDINYTANDTIRVYVGVEVDRYNAPNLDIFKENLSDELQQQIDGRESWASIADVLFSGATVRDIHTGDRVEYSPGYNKGVDWRDMTQSTTINDDRYIDNDLTITDSHAAFTLNGFGNTLQKLIGIKLQRNDAQTGDGAMMEIGLLQAFIRVNTSNQIQINTTVGSGIETWVNLNHATGAATLGSGGDNFLLFELVPSGANWEIVGDFYDGTNYHELNNRTFTPTGLANGNDLGFSRSAVQRGEVLEFKAINSPGYLTHSQLDQLLRQHVEDKWNFGYARLIEGADNKEVDFVTRIGLPNDPLIGTAAPTVTPDFVGQRFVDTSSKNVYIATDTGGSGDWALVTN